MTRFAFTFLLILLVAGCQTAGHRPQPPSPAKQFWARFLYPLKPDIGNNSADSESHLALHRPSTDILPINHTSLSLYKAGSILPPPHLSVQQAGDETVNEVTQTNAALTNTNPLQVQAGDTESFKRLLREIAVTPSDEWRVDDEKLSELLTSFRKEVMGTDIEADYLTLLRKRILPEPEAIAPFPQNEAVAVKRPARKSPPVQEYEPEEEEEFDVEPMIQFAERRSPARKEEPIVAKKSVPDYPNLSQIPTAASAVVQTSYAAPLAPQAAPAGYGAGDWQTPIRQAIEQLRYAIEQTPHGKTTSNELRLRMLETTLGNRSEAARPMQTADEAINRFMSHQVLGFVDLLDDTAPNSRSKYTSAVYRFNEGLLELQNLCPLKLKNVGFVLDYNEFGQYVPHPTNEFHPGEEFLVYIELENPTVHKIPDGYEVSVAISYEIRDSNAKIVDKKIASDNLTDRALSRKRDFRLGLGPCIVPTSLPPGQYQLRINVSDLHDSSMQYAEEQIPFRVAPSSSSSSSPSSSSPSSPNESKAGRYPR